MSNERDKTKAERIAALEAQLAAVRAEPESVDSRRVTFVCTYAADIIEQPNKGLAQRYQAKRPGMSWWAEGETPGEAMCALYGSMWGEENAPPWVVVDHDPAALESLLEARERTLAEIYREMGIESPALGGGLAIEWIREMKRAAIMKLEPKLRRRADLDLADGTFLMIRARDWFHPDDHQLKSIPERSTVIYRFNGESTWYGAHPSLETVEDAKACIQAAKADKTSKASAHTALRLGNPKGGRTPVAAVKRYPKTFKVWDRVKVNCPNGSHGTIIQVEGEKLYVLYEYGRDVHGNRMADFAWHTALNLCAVPDEEYAAAVDRDGWKHTS